MNAGRSTFESAGAMSWLVASRVRLTRSLTAIALWGNIGGASIDLRLGGEFGLELVLIVDSIGRSKRRGA
jgi:hypothetical protein